MAKMFKCPICDFKSKTFHGLVYHFRRVHNGNVCPICNREFKSLVTHYRKLSDVCEKHRILYALCVKKGKKELRNWVSSVLEVEMSVEDVVRYMKSRSIIREYESSVGFFFEYLEGSDELLDLLKGKKWSLETDGDSVILWVEKGDGWR